MTERDMDKIICRFVLLGKDRDYIEEQLIAAGVHNNIAEKAIEAWYEKRDNVNYNDVKAALTLVLQDQLADAVASGDTKGARQIVRLTKQVISVKCSEDKLDRTIDDETTFDLNLDEN